MLTSSVGAGFVRGEEGHEFWFIASERVSRRHAVPVLSAVTRHMRGLAGGVSAVRCNVVGGPGVLQV